MPDLDLREALHELADGVIPVDLLPGANRQLRARRRLQLVAAAIGTLVAVVGGVVAANGTSGGGRHRAPAVTTVTPTPSRTPTNATRSVLPAWLPAGVVLAGRGDVSPARFSPPPGWQPAARAWYRIAGRANANTIPPGGVTAQNDTRVHPATTLDIMFNPNIRTMPDVPTDPQYFFRRPVTIAGNHALVSTSNNGYGVVRIDWVDAFGYHVVMCQRLKTVEGPSGLGVDALTRIARSLYPGNE